MARITRKEQLIERRERVYELHNQGFTQSEIAAVVNYPRRTCGNDISLMRKRREEERRRRAEQQEHEARDVLEQARGTMKYLKKQAIMDFNSLSFKDNDQRDYRLEMYGVIGQLEDSLVELSLMSDGIEQKEALMRMRVRGDAIAQQLKTFEDNQREMVLNRSSSSSSNGQLQKESKVF